MAVQLSILLGNVAAQIALGYSRIEAWVSSDLGANYTEATSATAAVPTLTSTAANTTFNMGGKLLRFKIGGAAEQSVSFSSSLSQWTPAQVATQINTVHASLASVVGSSVVLTGAITGRLGSIEITYNDAHDLGFTAGTVVHGTDARPVLVGGTLSYTYIDAAGTTAFRYKWRLSANGLSPISEFSSPVNGSPLSASGVPLSVAFANFVGLDGKPLQARLIVVTEQNPQLAGGFYVTSAAPLLVDADSTGFLQLTLVQGTKVKVAIEGTAFVREFVVPSSPSFDIVQAMSSAADPFTVAVPPPFLIRRTI